MRAPHDVSSYRLAPLVLARLVGGYLVAFAVVLVVATVVIGLSGASPDYLVVVLAVGVVGLVALAWWLRSRLSVVTLTPTGYRTRLIRAAGVAEGRWADVEEAVAAAPRDVECLVLRRKDGRATTIPVALVAADKDDFARDVRARLRADSAGRTSNE
jgi:hypothetical protein